MSKNIILLPLLLLVFLSSCVSDDTDGCERAAALTVNFIYKDDTGRERFDENISSVTVYLFDEAERFAGSVRVDRESLDVFRGVRLDPEPGSYNVVCWGNITEEQDAVAGMEGTYMLTNMDSGLYYAPENLNYTRSGGSSQEEYEVFTVEVPETGGVEHTIAFMETSRAITMSLVNYKELTGSPDILPEVGLSGIPSGYSFLLSVATERTDFKATALQDGNDPGNAEAVFRTPYFLIDEHVEITLQRPGGEEPYTIFLEEILAESGIVPGYTDPLDLRMEFREGSLRISINGFTEIPVAPEIR